jgi:hypothetical protein
VPPAISPEPVLIDQELAHNRVTMRLGWCMFVVA